MVNRATAILSVAQQLLIRRQEPPDERLLRLFWNRSELKREFGKLQRERDRMVAQLRQQEGATLRVQQRLEQLEGLLGDPLRAANAAVFYQLRGVSQYVRRRLSRLARDLALRQQDQEAQREGARFEEHRQAALLAMQQRLLGLGERHAALTAEIALTQDQARQMRGFWNYFRRRALATHEAALSGAAEALELQQDRYEKARQEKLRESPGPPDGIGVEGKRIVNLSVIALAQELLLQLLDHDVAALAREASLRTAGEMSYGSIAACRELSSKIDTVLRRLDDCDDLPVRVRRRADFLRRQVIYRRDVDTVPVAASCGEIPWVLDGEGEPVAAGAILPVNVLADEYWEVYTVLLN